MEIKDIPEIDETLQEMQERVLEVDRWYNKDGSKRKTPLKNPRTVHLIKYFLTRSDLWLVNGSKDIDEELNRAKSSMRIYSHEGSSVCIKYKHGRVQITDGAVTTIMDVNDFLKTIRA